MVNLCVMLMRGRPSDHGAVFSPLHSGAFNNLRSSILCLYGIRCDAALVYIDDVL